MTAAAVHLDLPAGVCIMAGRQGDHVTGSVKFPHAVAGRTTVPIDYRNRPPSPLQGEGGEGRTPDFKTAFRIAVIEKWRDLCAASHKPTKREAARQAIAECGAECSPRTLYIWAHRLDTEGPAGLADRYAPAPRKVLSLEPNLAKDAVSIAAWWCFRIANVESIDYRVMHAAAEIRARAPYLRDVLGAIDAYYAWDTDRLTFPFKPFLRWAKYDFEKWLLRALEADHARSEAGAEATGAVPLQTTLSTCRRFAGDGSTTLTWGRGDKEKVLVGPVPDASTRAREVHHHGTKRAVANLGTSPSQGEVGEGHLLQGLADHYRWMLLKAARGERQALDQAVVTLAVWWESIPDAERHNIEARADAWKAAHQHLTTAAVARRKLAMLLPLIRRPRRTAEPVSKAIQRGMTANRQFPTRLARNLHGRCTAHRTAATLAHGLAHCAFQRFCAGVVTLDATVTYAKIGRPPIPLPIPRKNLRCAKPGFPTSRRNPL